MSDAPPPQIEIELETGETITTASDIRPFSTIGWPPGYTYAATRYADVILKESFHDRFMDLVGVLADYHPTLQELRSGGGNRTVFVKRFDDALNALRPAAPEQVWHKRNIEIEKFVKLDGALRRTTRTRDHEIDMFGLGRDGEPIPGIAVEMEWNNKDPFFDRDLVSYQALYQEGAIALGVIVTRGPRLQELIVPTIFSKKPGQKKYGASSTHWDKLIPRVHLGGGGGCPLILIGIEPERITGIALAVSMKASLNAAADFKVNWRNAHQSWEEAKPVHRALVSEAWAMMPPVTQVPGDDEVENLD